MNAKTLKALKGSIAKWRKRAAGNFLEVTPENCPLCALFITDDCKKCPVFAVTKETGCTNTPCNLYSEESDPHSERAIELAHAEVNFLKALLPRSGR